MQTEHLLQTKAFVLKSLFDLMDLRRVDYKELQGTKLRQKVHTIVHEQIEKIAKIECMQIKEMLITEIVDEAIGLGPIEPLIRDPSINEIMVNGPTQIFVERNGRLERTNTCFTNEGSLHNILGRIVAPLGRRIDEASPMVDARLPDGSRVNAIIRPLVLNGPTITIRKFSAIPLSITRLIELKTLSQKAAVFLKFSVIHRRNILIAGGTSSGKTTLLNSLSSFTPSVERIITIEDSAELRLPQSHVVSLESRPPNIEGKGEITIRDLVRNALRMRPDRIVVGECRGGEALDMLQAMNTGHDGSLTTIHANSPRDALLRLETLVLMAGLDLPIRAIREQIVSAIQLIVFASRLVGGSRVLTHITEVCGLEEGTIVTQDLFLKQQDDVELQFCGRLPKFADHLAQEHKQQLLGILNTGIQKTC